MIDFWTACIAVFVRRRVQRMLKRVTKMTAREDAFI